MAYDLFKHLNFSWFKYPLNYTGIDEMVEWRRNLCVQFKPVKLPSAFQNSGSVCCRSN